MLEKIQQQLGDEWGIKLFPFFTSEKYDKLSATVIKEIQNYNVFPSVDLIFEAFKKTPFSNVKIVLLGQDPYPTKGDAHGLAFSCLTKTPASLRIIFKELKRTHDIDRSHNLTDWADQGVLLLNQVLTVREGLPGSHKNIGWENLTIEVLKLLTEEKQGLVFMLFGKQAQSYIPYIQHPEKHCILAVDHPAASLYGGSNSKTSFIGSDVFIKADDYLGDNKIKW